MLHRRSWPTPVQECALLYGEDLIPQGVQADILFLNSSIGGLATTDIHHTKSPSTTTKTALVVYFQTMVAFVMMDLHFLYGPQI